MRWILILTSFFWLTPGYGQEELKSYTFEEVDSLYKERPRPILVFLNAEWCQICRQMEATVLSDSAVISMLNSRYYFIPFNGESRESVTYQNVKYTYQPSGINVGTHSLATALGQVDGKVNYPTLCILKNQTDVVFRHGGALSHKELLTVLVRGLEP